MTTLLSWKSSAKDPKKTLIGNVEITQRGYLTVDEEIAWSDYAFNLANIPLSTAKIDLVSTLLRIREAPESSIEDVKTELKNPENGGFPQVEKIYQFFLKERTQHRPEDGFLLLAQGPKAYEQCRVLAESVSGVVAKSDDLWIVYQNLVDIHEGLVYEEIDNFTNQPKPEKKK